MRSSQVRRVLSVAPMLISWFQHRAPRKAGTRYRHDFVFLILVGSVLLLLTSALFAESPEYRVIPIPAQLGYGRLNNSEVVAGTTDSRTTWMWNKGLITNLPGLGSRDRWARDINNNGVVVGSVSDSNGWGHACKWENGMLSTFDAPGHLVTWASSINSVGTVVGLAYDTTAGWPIYPFIFTGSVTALHNLENYEFNAINDGGVIAGTSWSSKNHESGRAFIYNGGTVTFLSAPGTYAEAFAINNSNHVLYEVNHVDFFIWKNGTQVLVESFTNFGGLNDYDAVVGYSSSLGAVIWENGEVRQLDALIDPNLGLHLSRACDINNKGRILCRGSDNMAYLLIPDSAITVRDAKNEIIPNVEFNLIKVSNDAPFFSEDTLGSFTTNGEGRLEMTVIAKDTFSVDLSTGTKKLVVGDSLKIAKHVQSVPAAKHPIVLGTMYSVHLDNAHFAEDSHMYFDTLKRSGLEVVLNHTELRYNLLVSVEWEATADYLSSLESNLSLVSNYLYDVTDGQLRLDTVYVFDNGGFASEADVLIHSNNVEWPRATYAGILHPGLGYLHMPRIFVKDSTTMRNYTDAAYPLDLTQTSWDYRAKAHELGHYALSFHDEYMFWRPDSNCYSPDNSLRCLPRAIFRYGFMDGEDENSGVMSSEMSNAFRYEMTTCRNTVQWRVHGMSCWDHFERWVEAVTWGVDDLFVPILKPDASNEDERVVTNPGVFFPGPNNDLDKPDYNVGVKIVFPNPPSPQAPDYSDKHVSVHHNTRGGDRADVQLINDGTDIIDQGQTSDAAGIWVLGAHGSSYRITAIKEGHIAIVTPSTAMTAADGVVPYWLYGWAESGGTGVSTIGNRYRANASEDSITIDLKEVQGDYPLVSSVQLLADSIKYRLTALRSFAENPSVELWPSYGGVFEYALSASGDGYEAVVTDSLGMEGSFTFWAVDDSASTFFVPTNYVVSGISHDQALIWLPGRGGQSEFTLDSANTSLTRALILSSRYPVIRTGLDESAVQAGKTHDLSVYPENPLTGVNQVVIRYDDADLSLGEDLVGDESALAVYHWADASTGWVMIGGTVDTAENAIYAAIMEAGVYAAFTTNIITDVEDDERGDIVPYKFELSQNYPNPFNPVTTIEYSVPSRTDITIEIFNVLGQKVRTLVNETRSAGSFRIEWNGADDGGAPVSTGVYLYRFQAGDVVQTKKMLLIK